MGDIIDIHDSLYKLSGHKTTESLYSIMKNHETFDQFREKLNLPAIRVEDDKLYAKPIKARITSTERYYYAYLFYGKNGKIMPDFSNAYALVPKKGFMVCIRVSSDSLVGGKVQGRRRTVKINTALDNFELVYMTNLGEFTYEIIRNPGKDDSFILFLDKSSGQYKNENIQFEADFLNVQESFGNVLNELFKNV